MKKKPMTPSEMGKKSAKVRKEKYGIDNWSEHMRQVSNAKRIKIKPISARNIDRKPK